ncbi:MAG TPA: transglycosylase SLT domain-containing protein [Myxococcota bacterium]|nr:transglycosylase SLT domain-containing protein [Myxococcota bacterium]
MRNGSRRRYSRAGGPRRHGGAALLRPLALILLPLVAFADVPSGAEARSQSAGQALRAAIEARKAGDVDRAAKLFAAVAKEYPVIADHAQLLRAMALLDAQQFALAITAVRDAEAQRPSSPLAPDLHRVMGDAQAGLGDDPLARKSWELALSETADPSRAAALRARIADSLAASGDARAAAQVYLELWRDAPITPEGRRAAERIALLEPSLGAPVRQASDYRVRAEVLLRNGNTEEALGDLNWALEHGLEAGARTDAAKQRGICLFRLRRYSEAEEAFAALASDEEAAIYRGRAAARAGDILRGAAELEKFAATASPHWAALARWYAGELLDGAGETDRARENFIAVSQQAADLSLVPQAFWRLAWSAYRAGDFSDARTWLARLEAAAGDSATRAQARYWNARAAERAGVPDVAQTMYTALVNDFPFTYYGWRARARAPAVQAEPAPLVLGPRVLSDADVERPRILLEAGLDGAASEEVSRLLRRGSADGQRLSLTDRLELADLFARAGDAHLGQSLVVDGFGDALAKAPPPSGEEPWRLAWPLAFREPVERAVAGKSPDLQPLVYAIMREESGYQPSAISPVGARGLLQLMPTTGAHLARLAGIEGFSAEALFTPETNLRLGAVYLDDLVRRFGGRLSAAIASYNAGPEAVSRWLEAHGDLADDEWVEDISYEQTRGYVKRVLRSLHVYRALYPQ